MLAKVAAELKGLSLNVYFERHQEATARDVPADHPARTRSGSAPPRRGVAPGRRLGPAGGGGVLGADRRLERGRAAEGHGPDYQAPVVASGPGPPLKKNPPSGGARGRTGRRSWPGPAVTTTYARATATKT